MKRLSLPACLCYCLVLMTSNTLANEPNCQKDDILATSPSSRFTVFDDVIVLDKKSGLMWQKCLIGLSGKMCDKGKAESFNWRDALLLPTNASKTGSLAGYSDWRIPNIRELSTIIEQQCTQPAINLSIFPNTTSGHVWSSSPYRFYPHYSWYLDFNDGIYTYGERIDRKYVRLVRNID